MNPEEYRYLYELEEQHGWFVGMRRIAAGFLDRYLPCGAARILDVGCGTGYMLRWLRRYSGGQPVVGLDLNSEALRFCRQRKEQLLVRGSAAALPLAANTFDLVLMLDVLDCFPQEVAGRVLSALSRVLKEDGLLLVRVPAFQSLYSEHDQAVGTVHRYTKGELRQLLLAQGLEPLRVCYANSVVFPAAAVWRWVKRSRRSSAVSDVRPFPKGLRWLNAFLRGALALEAAWLRRLRWGLPFGLSVMAVARKPVHGELKDAGR